LGRCVSERIVLLTGLPRSGTTLACELLNQLPDTVALDEPIAGESFKGWTSMQSSANEPAPDAGSRVVDNTVQFLQGMRDSIAQSGKAVSRHVGGRVSGAEKIADDEQRAGVRREVAERGEVKIDKELSEEFLLVVKHPAEFTAVLDLLAEQFPVYAVIRNPLSLLTSWQTVPLAVRRGRSPFAETVDRDLANALGGIDATVDRQLHLLGWFFQKYRSVLPQEQVIRYESIVESRGKALSVVTPAANALDERLESRNRAAVYDHDAMRRLGELLLDTDGPYWDFYPRESVERLVSATR